MGKSKRDNISHPLFERLAIFLTRFAGSTTAFVIAISIIFLWSVSGPLFNFSETWQLVINTGTTIITFLMVFLIQRAQNKDSLAIQLKLNELIAATQGASNRLVEVEDLSEKELNILKSHYQQLAILFEKDYNIGESHSIDEAKIRHKTKLQTKKKIL